RRPRGSRRAGSEPWSARAAALAARNTSEAGYARTHRSSACLNLHLNSDRWLANGERGGGRRLEPRPRWHVPMKWESPTGGVEIYLRGRRLRMSGHEAYSHTGKPPTRSTRFPIPYHIHAAAVSEIHILTALHG